jgi:hypothetical protein
MKVYISGKITGVPPEDAARQFADAQNKLTAQGYSVVNPFENGLPDTADYATHMTIDILMLLGCDAIYMLAGSEQSNGAMLELRIAQATGKQITFQDATTEQHSRISHAIHDVCGVPPDELAGECRQTMNVYARMICAKVMREQGADIDTIKKHLNKTYGSVLHYLRTFNNEVQTNKQFKELYVRINEMINS